MNLLERANRDGRNYRKASTANGGEYHGPCPICGGTDRFHIWPAQGDHGTFWCRSCGLRGDAIEYLMKIEGIPFREACKEVGKALPENDEYQTPRFRRTSSAETFQPRVTASPADLWIQHAEKLVDWAHQQLLANPEQLAWCAARGLDLAGVKTYRLGWNPGEKGKDLYRAREAWGLETVIKDNGKPKKLWLPIGLVIPYYRAGALHRVRIRRPEGEPRYYLVPGSGTSPMLLGGTAKAYVIVESELDAILIHHLAGDLVGVISQGNSTAKPDTGTAIALQSAIAILITLDSDDAGMTASVWWKKQYPQAERWPVPAGKDPGEAYKAGVDLRVWVTAGLPPVLTLPPPPIPAATPPHQDISPVGTAAAPPQRPDEAVAPVPEACNHKIVTATGRTLAITDNRTDYAELAAQGIAVFTPREIYMIRSGGINRDRSELLIDVKECFPGCWVSRVEQLKEVV